MSFASPENNDLDRVNDLKDDLLEHVKQLSIRIKELEERLSRSIELSPEDFKFLTELSAEMKSQDNCGTASPQFFTVQTTEMKGAYDPNYTDDIGYVFPDEDYRVIMVDDIDEMNEFIMDCEIERKITDSDEFEEFLEAHDIRYEKTGFKEETNYENAFLTSKACRKYIENDRHNLRQDPRCYCMYAQKNPELRGIIDVLKKYFAPHVNEEYEHMKREVQGRLSFLLSDRRNDESWRETYNSINKNFMSTLKGFSKRNPEKYKFEFKNEKGLIEVVTENGGVEATFYPHLSLNKVYISLHVHDDFKSLIDSIFLDITKEG